jgi:hypothetical protein
MDQEIASAINRVLFNQLAPLNVRIMSAKTNAQGAITAFMHQNATVEMAMQYHNIIIIGPRMVNK